MDGNLLYYGDNLDVLQRYVKDESVDLVYLDPPFNSNATYNLLFAQRDGTQAAAQIEAFEDTWIWDTAASAAFHEVVTGGGAVAQVMVALQRLLGERTDMLAYLSMMAPRLLELRRVLKPTGSIYLHCDPAASHYLKLLMDAIFHPTNFRNEIVWKRFNFHADAHRFGRVTDRILFYTASQEYTFNVQRAPFSAAYEAAKFTHVDEAGRRYRLDNLNPPGGRGPVYEFNGVTKAWRVTREHMLELEKEGRVYTGSRVAQLKRYLDELDGQAVHELWNDIPPINPRAKERLGYPTQKPEALLERIIEASSNEEDVVLDPFCGCGTAVAAAEGLNRRWIGIDITYLAVGLIKKRLMEHYPGIHFDVVGAPTTTEDAKVLAESDPYQFQFWVMDLIGAGGSRKEGPDRGIDGRLFFTEGAGEAKEIIVSVKAGRLQPTFVDALLGVLQKEGAEMGALISFNEPTRAMREIAASAGFYESSGWGKFPRLQLRTVTELLAGKDIEYPRTRGANVTYKRAQAKQVSGGDQLALVAEGEPDEPYETP